MATADSNGLVLYNNGDQLTPLAPVLNAITTSVSNAFNKNARIWNVANIAARTTLVSQIGAGNISVAKPLFVWRGDAATGKNLEYTINGTDWFTYGSDAVPLDDTGWVDCAVTAGISIRTGDAGNPTRYRPQVRRIGKTVYFKGHFNPLTSSSPSVLFTVPAGFEPVEEVRWLAFSTNRAYSPFGGYLPPNGVCTIQTPSAGSPQYPPAHFSPIIPPYLVN